MPDDATHLLVIQDDAWPCDGFHDRAAAVIAEHPATTLAFFTPGFSHITRAVNVYRKAGANVMPHRGNTFVPMVAIAYPAEIPRGILEWEPTKKHSAAVVKHDDGMVASFMCRHRKQVLVTLPSLVQHLNLEPSMMKYDKPDRAHRRAAWYEESPALA